MITIEKLLSLTTAFELNTPRLHLRRFKSHDLAAEMKQQQDPEVVRYIREPMSDVQAVEYFEQFIRPFRGEEHEWLGICVTLGEKGPNVGAISFRFESLEFAIAEIGYRFDPVFQGKGYAVEAIEALVDFLFKTVKVHKIVAYCDPENLPSFKLMEKLSMQREGQLRQHFKIGEQWRDVLVYGLLNDEYKAG